MVKKKKKLMHEREFSVRCTDAFKFFLFKFAFIAKKHI